MQQADKIDGVGVREKLLVHVGFYWLVRMGGLYSQQGRVIMQTVWSEG